MSKKQLNKRQLQVNENTKQRAVCICTDLWEVTTTNTYKRNTLVSAKSAKQAKEKTLSYLQGCTENYIWPQRIRI